MKYIKPMNIKEFSDFLATLKHGETINFGTFVCSSRINEITDPDDVENWYFATVMEIKEYRSRFILIDYAGGGQAYAIPLDGDNDTCDAAYKYIVSEYIKQFFLSCSDLGSLQAKVYVELDDEEKT